MIWVILVVEEEDFEARLSGTTDEGRRRNLHGSGHENRGSAFDVIKTEVFLVRETRSPSSPRTEKERKRKHLNSHLNKVISKDTYVCVHIFKISGFSFLSLEVTVSRCTAPWPPRRRNEPPPRAWLMDLWWQKFTDQTCLAFVQFSETILALGSERERERKKKRCKGQGSIYLVGPGRDRPTRCSNNDKPHPGPSFGQWVTRCTPPRPSFS